MQLFNDNSSKSKLIKLSVWLWDIFIRVNAAHNMMTKIEIIITD